MSLRRNRNYVRLWCAATTSHFGTMLHAIALPFTAIIVLDATPRDIALLGAAGLIPGTLLGLAAGAAVDRLRRKPLLIATDWLRAGVTASIPAAALLGVLSLVQLYAVAFLLGLLGFLFGVAHHAFLPSVVERKQLVAANAQFKVAEAVTEGGAFALGGWLVQVLTAPLVLGIDALTFVVSALFLRRLDAPEPRRERSERRNTLAEVREGLSFIRGRPLLVVLAISDALASLSFRISLVAYMLFVYDELGFTPAFLGVVFAVGSVSSFVAAWFTDRIVAHMGVGPSMIVGYAVMGASMLLLPLAPGATLAGVVLLVLHQAGDGGAIVYEIGQSSALQVLTPDEMLGRVRASLRTLSSGAMLAGVAAGGVLGETIGLRGTLLVAGLAATAGALLLALSPLRRLERLEAL